MTTSSAELGAQLRALQDEVRALKDREAIRERLDTYVALLDAGRYSDIPAEIFTPDAVDYHAPLEGERGIMRGHAQIGGFLCDVMPMFSATQHMLGNIHIEVDADRAHTRAYALCSHWLSENGSGTSDLTTATIYDDDWTRTTDGWRILERHVYACGPNGRVIGTAGRSRLTPQTELFGPR